MKLKFVFLLFLNFLTVPAKAFTLTGNFSKAWPGSTLKFSINTSNCPANIISAFNDAAELWNSVSTSKLKLKMGSASSTVTPAQLAGGTATGSPVIVCDPSFNSTTGSNEDYVAGVGFSSFVNSSYMNYGGLILNASSGQASINSMSKTDVSIILAHEIGHVLGIGHSDSSPALMYYNASYKKELRLSQDDWDAMTYLYPANELDENPFGCALVDPSMPSGPSNGLWVLFFILPIGLLLKLKDQGKNSSAEI